MTGRPALCVQAVLPRRPARLRRRPGHLPPRGAALGGPLGQQCLEICAALLRADACHVHLQAGAALVGGGLEDVGLLEVAHPAPVQGVCEQTNRIDHAGLARVVSPTRTVTSGRSGIRTRSHDRNRSTSTSATYTARPLADMSP